MATATPLFTTRKTDPVHVFYLFVVVLCCNVRHSFSFHTTTNTNINPSSTFRTIMSTKNSPRMSTSTSLSAFESKLDWQSLDTFVAETLLDPSTLCRANKDHPRLAKDTEYANAVMDAWKGDISSCNSSINTIGCKCLYYRESELGEMNGYLVAPSILTTESETSSTKKQTKKYPAVVLFHTGAGPQDIFLRWKADILVRELGCVVLIADIISDPDGYAWSGNRERYNAARKRVLATSITSEEEEGGGGGRSGRWALRRVVSAAMDCVKGLDFVDGGRIAGLGWCMGGHPILELGLMQEDCVRTLVSYHGVFDGVDGYEACETDISSDVSKDQAATRTRVLICNGKDDPFVQQDDLKKAKDLMEMKGCDVTVLNFDGVKHGFTNPAQDYNPSDNFVFNEQAAKKSWDSTIRLLRDTLCSS